MTRDFCRFKIKDRNRVPVVNLVPFPTDRSFRPSRPGRYPSLSQLTDPYFTLISQQHFHVHAKSPLRQPVMQHGKPGVTVISCV